MSSNNPHSKCGMDKYDILRGKKSERKKKGESKYLATIYDMYFCIFIHLNQVV